MKGSRNPTGDSPDPVRDRAVSFLFRSSTAPERTCVWCGCTDTRACAGGCAWAITHSATPTGVCSRCLPLEVNALESLSD